MSLIEGGIYKNIVNSHLVKITQIDYHLNYVTYNYLSTVYGNIGGCSLVYFNATFIRQIGDLLDGGIKLPWSDPRWNDWVPGSLKLDCHHTMQSYVGITEAYKFCTKCDHKENV